MVNNMIKDEQVLEIIEEKFGTIEFYDFCKKEVLKKLKDDGIFINDRKNISKFLKSIRNKYYTFVVYEDGFSSLKKAWNCWTYSIDEIFTDVDEYTNYQLDLDRTLLLHDCRCFILQINSFKRKPVLYTCYKKNDSTINSILNTIDKMFKDLLKIPKVKKIKSKYMDLNEEREEVLDNEHEKGIKKGIYTMMTNYFKEKCPYWKIVTKSSGFRAGEFITFAHTTDVPIYPMIMQLFHDLTLCMDLNCCDFGRNVLWLSCSNNKSILDDLYDKVIAKDPLFFSNNIIFGCDNVRLIETCIKKLKPKIIIVDNFQQLDGQQAKNADALSKICRKYGVCLILLYELNNVKPKSMPDITKISSKSNIADRADKIYILWNSQQEWWRKIDGDKHDLYAIVCDLVKNRQSRLIREFLFYFPLEYCTEIPTSENENQIIEQLNEKYYSKNNNCSEFDSCDISSAICDLKREISSSKPFMMLKSGIIL